LIVLSPPGPRERVFFAQSHHRACAYLRIQFLSSRTGQLMVAFITSAETIRAAWASTHTYVAYAAWLSVDATEESCLTGLDAIRRFLVVRSRASLDWALSNHDGQDLQVPSYDRPDEIAVLLMAALRN
jgi:hypothetical protein